MNTATCRLCGLTWTPKVPVPRACPGCKTYKWQPKAPRK